MSAYLRLGHTKEILSCLAPNGLPWCVAEVLTIGPLKNGSEDCLLRTDLRVFPMKQADDCLGYVVDGMGLEYDSSRAKPPPAPRPPSPGSR